MPKFTILTVSEFFMVQFRGASYINIVCNHPRPLSPDWNSAPLKHGLSFPIPPHPWKLSFCFFSLGICPF